MNLDGSNAVDVGPGSMPTWSPSGTKLAYLDLFPTAGNPKGVYINPLNGQAPTLLAPLDVTAPGDGIRVSWSPSGNFILVYQPYTSRYAGTQYAINATTGQVIVYSTEEAGPAWATFTPDGTSMLAAYTNPNCASTSFLFYSAQTTVYCTGTTASIYAPALSPDGSTVAWYNFNYPENQILSAAVQGTASQIVASDHSIMSFDWGRVPHATVATTLANGQWSTPVQMPDDNYSLQTAVAVMPGDGAVGQTRRQMVSINADGVVLHRMQYTNNTWSPFTVVPGLDTSPGGIIAKRVAVAGAMDGSVQVVVVGKSDIVYHAMRYANGNWSGFTPLGGFNGGTYFAARDVAIAVNGSTSSSPGYAQVVALGWDVGDVFHRVRWADGSWTPFAPVPGAVSSATRLAIAIAPATASAPNDLYVLATTSQGVQRQMRRADGSWDTWVSVAGAPTAPKDLSLTIALATNQTQIAKVSYVAADGTVSLQQRSQASMRNSWTMPIVPTTVMANGRTVSIANTATGADFFVVRADPQ